MLEASKSEAAAEVAAKAAEASGAGKSGRTVQQVMSQLSDRCVSKRIDYWDYEVCLFSSIKQFHMPDVYPLGTFVRWEGDKMFFDNGAPCEGRLDSKPRCTTVSFACLEGDDTLISLDEPAMCEYSMLVGTRLACEFPQFPKVSAHAAYQQPQREEKAPDDGSEDWFLTLSELGDGRFACQLSSTELRAAGSKLFFLDMELLMVVENLERPAAVAGTTSQVIARLPGRVPLSSDQLEVTTDEGGSRSTRVKASSSFRGQVAFVKAFA